LELKEFCEERSRISDKTIKMSRKKEMKAPEIQTFCQHCHMKCRIFCRIENGRITNIVNAMGIKDKKAEACIELIYHPDRIIHPLKRVGDRGEGKWKRISWDEALDIMANRFTRIEDEFGAEAIATVMGCGHKMMTRVATFLFSHIMGTPNILDINQQCSIPLGIAETVTFGDNICADFGPHLKDSKCILVWGSNTRNSRLPLDRDINLAQVNGAKVIKVDPRPPEMFDINRLGLPAADIWLRLRPGTDAALALGMINIIIKEGLYNKEFVDKWCLGFEELRNHVQDYSVEKVSEITWVPKDKIIEATRLFASIKPSCVHSRLGVGSQHINATQSSRAVCILTAIAADIDVRGGNLLSDRPVGREVRRFKPTFPPGIEEKRLGAKEFPLVAGSTEKLKDFIPQGYAHNQLCIQAMLNRKIKALFVPGCNMVVSEADSKKTETALKNLDFLVVVDLFMTPTAELADIVLPPAHFLETEIPMRAYQRMGPNYMNYILASRKVIEPVGECWDDRKIVIELAKRMNIDPPWRDIEEQNDWQLEEFGIKYKDILNKPNQMISWPLRYKKYDEEGFRFNTPSEKIELYSSIFANHGYDPLPIHIEPPQSPISTPELYKSYPLILTNHRSIFYIHSEFRQLSSIRKEFPEPLIEINPKTASDLGITEGNQVYVEAPGFEQRVYMKAKFSTEIHPRVVTCVPLWWFPEKTGPEHGAFESNINTIISTDPPYDPIGMNYQMRAGLCRVGKSKNDEIRNLNS
jgi:anaerobic selenocysteine-containing dehydrogenase